MTGLSDTTIKFYFLNKKLVFYSNKKLNFLCFQQRISFLVNNTQKFEKNKVDN